MTMEIEIYQKSCNHIRGIFIQAGGDDEHSVDTLLNCQKYSEANKKSNLRTAHGILLEK